MRDMVISIRVSEEEHSKLAEEAAQHRVSLSTYARMLMFEGASERTVRTLLDMLENDKLLRLRLRSLLVNPLEGE